MRTRPRLTADDVRELRLMNGMTQKNLADILCISIKTVQAYEQGQRTMLASTWILTYLCAPAFGRHDLGEERYSLVGHEIDVNKYL